VPEPVRAVLLDDNDAEARSLCGLLQSDDLVLDAMVPRASIDDTLADLEAVSAADGAKVVLLDYRLDDRSTSVRFRGGSVAGGLKDRHPDVPVILLTTDEKLRQWVAKRPGMEELFDWTLIKGDINDEATRGRSRAEVIGIARGWRLLNTADRGSASDVWDWLAGLLEVDADLLGPFAALTSDPPALDAPSEVAHWLLRGPLHWPGPLYGFEDTRVLCGLSIASFDTEAVQEWLKPLRYEGPFHEFVNRWWTGPLRERISEALGDAPNDAPSRAAAIGAAVGTDLESEACTWCGRGRTSRACTVCGKAADPAHSLRKLTDPPPAWADASVVCFRCVVEGEAQGVRFGPGDEDIVAGLEEGSIVPPEETPEEAHEA
jgi:hypothetical protein